MFSDLCLFAVTPVSCSCLLSLKTALRTQGSRLLHLICFAPLSWRKRGANPPHLAICTGFFLQSNAERLWPVDISTLRMGFVSSRAGCCTGSWVQPGLEDQRVVSDQALCPTGSVSGTGQDALDSYHSSNAKSMPQSVAYSSI